MRAKGSGAGGSGVGEFVWAGTGAGCDVTEAGEVGAAAELAPAVGVGIGAGWATDVGSMIRVGPEVGGEPGVVIGATADGTPEQPAAASREIVINPNKCLSLIFLTFDLHLTLTLDFNPSLNPNNLYSQQSPKVQTVLFPAQAGLFWAT